MQLWDVSSGDMEAVPWAGAGVVSLSILWSPVLWIAYLNFDVVCALAKAFLAKFFCNRDMYELKMCIVTEQSMFCLCCKTDHSLQMVSTCVM